MEPVRPEPIRLPLRGAKVQPRYNSRRRRNASHSKRRSHAWTWQRGTSSSNQYSASSRTMTTSPSRTSSTNMTPPTSASLLTRTNLCCLKTTPRCKDGRSFLLPLDLRHTVSSTTFSSPKRRSVSFPDLTKVTHKPGRAPLRTKYRMSASCSKTKCFHSRSASS